MARVKTITLHLIDGTSNGRWKAKLGNWDCIAYKIPHNQLSNCKDLKDINAPGVYFLFGEENKQFIYVGEAENVRTRISQPHTFDKDGGSYWNEAIILVTPGGMLEKGRVKYLENRFYELAVKAKRYVVKNSNTPTQSRMSEETIDMLEDFIDYAKLLVAGLGYTPFDSLPEKVQEVKEDTDLLYFSRNGIQAFGKNTDSGFYVLKGSTIANDKLADYVSSGIKEAREKYASKIQKGILQEDICFGSSSTAATFVCGRSCNGLVEWKNKEGIKLKELVSKESIKPSNLYHLKSTKIKATGKESKNGFVVCKGSGFIKEETDSCPSYIRDDRKALIKEGKVKGYIFVKDVEFSSSSRAASVVLGRSCNGLETWVDENNQCLKDKQ